MGNSNSGRNDIFSIIKKHYLNADPELSITDIGLPDECVRILERWIFIDIQRSKNYPRKDTTQILNLWRRKYNLSAGQFYVDLRNCERLFGETAKINKEYERLLSIKTYDMLLSLALAKGDIKNAIEAQKRKDLLTGIEKKDSDELPFEAGDRTYNMTFNMVLNGEKVNEKVIDISNLQKLPIKDLRELTQLVNRPEADMNLMEKLIDDIAAEDNEE